MHSNLKSHKANNPRSVLQKITVAVPRRLSHTSRRTRQPPGAPDPSSRPLFDFENYASSEDDDEEDETIDNNQRQRPNRFSTHRVPGLDGGFYHSE